MPFSQIFPPSPSPTESIRLFYTSVSLLLSCTQGYCYHLSKFHIYALVYCIGAHVEVLKELELFCFFPLMPASVCLSQLAGNKTSVAMFVGSHHTIAPRLTLRPGPGLPAPHITGNRISTCKPLNQCLSAALSLPSQLHDQRLLTREFTTRRGTATPVHRPQRPAGSTHSSTRGLRPPEHV